MVAVGYDWHCLHTRAIRSSVDEIESISQPISGWPIIDRPSLFPFPAVQAAAENPI